MTMLCFKFHKNRTINEEIDFFEGGGGEGANSERGGGISKQNENLQNANLK